MAKVRGPRRCPKCGSYGRQSCPQCGYKWPEKVDKRKAQPVPPLGEQK